MAAAPEKPVPARTAVPATAPVALKSGLHASFRDLPWDSKRWPHFRPQELACKCTRAPCDGEYFHNPAFLDALERLRTAMDAPLKINSGRRCAKRNKAVGGASQSQHLVAIAADIALGKHDPKELAREAVEAGFTGIGFGRTFLHVDMRAKREAFHYPGGAAAWTQRFGFDPAARLDAGGKL